MTYLEWMVLGAMVISYFLGVLTILIHQRPGRKRDKKKLPITATIYHDKNHILCTIGLHQVPRYDEILMISDYDIPDKVGIDWNRYVVKGVAWFADQQEPSVQIQVERH